MLDTPTNAENPLGEGEVARVSLWVAAFTFFAVTACGGVSWLLDTREQDPVAPPADLPSLRSVIAQPPPTEATAGAELRGQLYELAQTLGKRVQADRAASPGDHALDELQSEVEDLKQNLVWRWPEPPPADLPDATLALQGIEARLMGHELDHGPRKSSWRRPVSMWAIVGTAAAAALTLGLVTWFLLLMGAKISVRSDSRTFERR